MSWDSWTSVVNLGKVSGREPECHHAVPREPGRLGKSLRVSQRLFSPSLSSVRLLHFPSARKLSRDDPGTSVGPESMCMSKGWNLWHHQCSPAAGPSLGKVVRSVQSWGLHLNLQGQPVLCCGPPSAVLLASVVKGGGRQGTGKMLGPGTRWAATSPFRSSPLCCGQAGLPSPTLGEGREWGRGRQTTHRPESYKSSFTGREQS